MTILITGAGGFLGRRIARALLARGRLVRGLDLAYAPAPPEGMEAQIGSIADPVALRAAVAGAEAVIHCAAIAHLWTPDAADYERVNVAGSAALFEAASAAGMRRVVHVSSYVTQITGRRGAPDRVVSEADVVAEADMLGAYPRSKWRAEAAARQAAEATGLEIAILAPSAPVGPGDWRLTPPTKMLLDLANGALPATIDCRLNLVGADAVAAAAIAALDADAGRWGAPWRRWLATGEDIEMDAYLAHVARIAGVATPAWKAPYTVALLAAHVEEALAAATARSPGAPLTGVRLAGPRLRFDARRARSELGFTPPPIAEALRDALLWLRDAGLTRRPLPGLDAVG